MTDKINRKRFFKILLYLTSIPVLFLLNRMWKDQKRYGSGNQKLKISSDIPQGLSISGPVIINKVTDDIKIYSSKCTHLGCRITKIENNEIVCPCHGSRYNSDGEPVKGPSIKPLETLKFNIDKESNEIIINLV